MEEEYFYTYIHIGYSCVVPTEKPRPLMDSAGWLLDIGLELVAVDA